MFRKHKIQFIGNLEVEVPLEFSINNIQFADTIDNFFSDNSDNNSSFGPDNLKYLKTVIDVENGFPLGISMNMSLYDSKTKIKKSTINATDILKPAAVGANGKVTTSTKSTTSIEVTDTFWNAINSADKVIISFTLNTTDNGTKNVKIYSDYKISFNMSFVVKPDISLN